MRGGNGWPTLGNPYTLPLMTVSGCPPGPVIEGGRVVSPSYVPRGLSPESGFEWGTLIAGVGSTLVDLFSGDSEAQALAQQNAMLQQQLQQQQMAQAAQRQSGGVPTWVWVAGGGLVLFLLLRK